MTRFWIGFLNKFSGALQPPKLDQTEQDELIELLREDQPWKKQEIEHLLDEEFNVESHKNYFPTFLYELGLHYAIPRTKRPDRPENAEEILDKRVEYAFDEDAHSEPHNKREGDEEGED